MIVGKLSDHDRRWIIGDFDKSLLRTKDFEVCVRVHPKGEVYGAHYHKLITEYNVLISGKMTMCGVELNAGDTFIVETNEIADPIFLEDCTVVCVKTPSIPGDKYIV
jgi:mannose-6-phosphate isomerase-like protein (cupin superfamily)